MHMQLKMLCLTMVEDQCPRTRCHGTNQILKRKIVFHRPAFIKNPQERLSSRPLSELVPIFGTFLQVVFNTEREYPICLLFDMVKIQVMISHVFKVGLDGNRVKDT